MIAKWYQYDMRPAQRGQAGEDLGEAHRQRHRAAGASGHVFADLARELGEVHGREPERRVDGGRRR